MHGCLSALSPVLVGAGMSGDVPGLLLVLVTYIGLPGCRGRLVGPYRGSKPVRLRGVCAWVVGRCCAGALVCLGACTCGRHCSWLLVRQFAWLLGRWRVQVPVCSDTGSLRRSDAWTLVCRYADVPRCRFAPSLGCLGAGLPECRYARTPVRSGAWMLGRWFAWVPVCSDICTLLRLGVGMLVRLCAGVPGLWCALALRCLDTRSPMRRGAGVSVHPGN